MTEVVRRAVTLYDALMSAILDRGEKMIIRRADGTSASCSLCELVQAFVPSLGRAGACGKCASRQAPSSSSGFPAQRSNHARPLQLSLDLMNVSSVEFGDMMGRASDACVSHCTRCGADHRRLPWPSPVRPDEGARAEAWNPPGSVVEALAERKRSVDQLDGGRSPCPTPGST